MAKYTIKSASGQTLASAFPTYHGAYGKPTYLEFTIYSPTPISFAIGSYVDYRGKRYKLFSLPEPMKQARSGEAMDAFVYQNLQFYDQTKELENLIFTDLVLGSDGYFFSSRESTSTYENLSGIINRLQECANEQSGQTWVFEKASGFDGDADLKAVADEPHEFSINGQSLLEVCNQITDVYKGVGWLYTFDSGTGYHHIVFGAPNIRAVAGTTGPFLYGKGKGLVSIKKYLTNKDTFLTRLYAYGSEKNLPLRWYNKQTICSKDAVDIPNLMLPISTWGEATDPDSHETRPDARLAFINDADKEAEYGLIPKRVYFNNEENGDIFPSIKGMTIADVRIAATQAHDITYYSPSTAVYTDATARVDEIKVGSSVSDDGDISSVEAGGTEPLEEQYNSILLGTRPSMENELQSQTILSRTETGWQYATDRLIIDICNGTLATNFLFGHFAVKTNFPDTEQGEMDYEESIAELVANLVFYDANDEVIATVDCSPSPNLTIDGKVVSGGTYNPIYKVSLPTKTITISNPELYNFTFVKVVFDFGIITEDGGVPVTYGLIADSRSVIPNNSFSFTSHYSVKDTADVVLPQIGFDLKDLTATNGYYGSLNLLDGMCGGRSFKIRRCTYRQATDDWVLRIIREKDESTGMYYPNSIFEINTGDRYNLTDIYMPDAYVEYAMQRLLVAAQSYFDLNSVPRFLFTPEINAAKIADGTLSLPLPGMYMEITDAQITGGETQYILIDSVAINEGESNIPTIQVTLREKLNVPAAPVSST